MESEKSRLKSQFPNLLAVWSWINHFASWDLSFTTCKMGVIIVQSGFPGGSAVKNLPAMQGARVRSLGQEDPLDEGMAAHPSILAWEIP